ncbi:GntR family transcriptional regulator [Kitasatospora sp. NPDC059722]|uniref:GntR family transcriptional regulator n=1 Tax=Kitasatospora sp. NPDC059722 TaxID=3346925 RepID=UPI003684F97B
MNHMNTNPHEPTPAEARIRRHYKTLAAHLVRGLPPGLPPDRLPPAWKIACWYRIPLSTAQFVRRAATTRLRPPLRLCPDDPSCPVWVGVAADLRERIREGRFSGRMPGRKPLAAAYKVGTDTIGKALELLADEHLVEIRPGTQGTYVSQELLDEEEVGRYDARAIGVPVSKLDRDAVTPGTTGGENTT